MGFLIGRLLGLAEGRNQYPKGEKRMPVVKPIQSIVRTKNSNAPVYDCANKKSARKQPFTELLSLALKAGIVWQA